MGEIAEAMLVGDMCQGCGEWLGSGEGLPRFCAGCRRAERREKHLPRANRYSIPPREGTIQCAHCPAWIKPGQGQHDHMRAKHPELIKERRHAD